MAVPTDQELLDAILVAIRKVTLGHSAEWNGNKVTMAELPDLEAARVNLEGRLGLRGGSPRYKQATFN